MRRVAFLLVVLAESAAFAAVQFTDGFTGEPDGALVNWVQVLPSATIESERLLLTPVVGTTNQPNVWAGKAGVPIFFGTMTSVTCTVEFGPAPADADGVGRHGGLIFCGTTPTHRYDPTFSGYFVDWIDRTSDHGFRVFRVLNGVHTGLAVGTPAIAEPPSQWTFAFTDTGFQLSADGELIFDIADTTYRGGYFGCWCYYNYAGAVAQRMYVDDIVLDLAAESCPLLYPAAVNPRMGDPDVQFQVTAPFGANDAGPYLVRVASTDPTVATVGGGASVDVVFEQGGALTKSFALQELKLGTTELHVTASGAPCDTSMVPVEVVPTPTTQFLEDFTGESDGAPADCVVAAADASIISEEMHLVTSGVEPHAWLGHQGLPLKFSEVARIDCRITWGTAASAPILRHGGLAFCAENPTSRWSNPNYTFDYLERDQTFRVGRGFANGTQAWLAVVGGRADPGSEWSIVLTGATMAFIVDGETIAEVVETTHRSGYIGFWCYSNTGQEMIVDDVEVVFTGATCSSITPASVALRPWYAVLPIYTVEIPFGANFTADYTVTVTSSRPDIAKPLGADAGGALPLVFSSGGVMAQSFEIECFDVPGTARLNVTEPGAPCTDVFAEVVVLPEGAKEFSDDFSQADGAPENWTVVFPDWQVSGGLLTNAPALTREADVFAGNPAIRFEYVERIAAAITWGDVPAGDVGRHGGLVFYATVPDGRGYMSGYEIDWIDRVTDHGYRLLRFDNGVETAVLAGPTLDPNPDPGTAWEIVIDGDLITFSVDGEEVFTADDPTYRDGYIGAWVFQNNSVMMVDDFVVGEGIGPTEPRFKRGDTNDDDRLNIADAVCLLGYLFGKEGDPCKVSVPRCLDGADNNNDGVVNIADAVKVLGHLFAQTGPLPEPFSACGLDPALPPTSLGCTAYAPCQR